MRLTLFLLICCVAFSCKIAEQDQHSLLNIKPWSDSIRYTGRVKNDRDSMTLYWSGTSIAFRFKGKSVKALMRDEVGKNYFNVVIDGDCLSYFKANSLKGFHTLAENLPEGEHTVELIKRSEWDRGKTWFYGLQIEDATLLPLGEKNKRVIEFFGNSITAGYAIEDYSGGDSPDSIYTNNYDTYAAITARHFKADMFCTVKSGIGILISWFPLTMPEMYDRLDPSDSSSKWHFKNVTPDVVVINLFQNDSWLLMMPEHESFKMRFGTKAPDERQIVDAYKDFVSKIRAVYPEAYIICVLGNMDATRPGSPWPGYVTQAVTELHDKKVLTHFFPFMNKGGHPRREDNQQMAGSLIKFIEQNISW